jgi:kynurenine formamidase
MATLQIFEQDFNTDSPTDPSTFHFPGWHEDAISWLINQRSVNIVGVDTPSTDYGQSSTFPVHVLLGDADISGAENVANLDLIPNFLLQEKNNKFVSSTACTL